TAHHTARWAGALSLLLAGAASAAGPPVAWPVSSALRNWQPAVPPPGPAVPTVSLRVRVPAEVAGGKDLTYVITAANDSDAAAQPVTVRAPLPATATFVRSDPEPTEKGKALVWKFGTFKPDTRRAITLVLAPAGEEDVQACAYLQFEHGQCVRT